MNGVRTGAWLIPIALMSTAVRADFAPVSQARSVQVSASETFTQDGMPRGLSRNDTRMAGDFAPFTASLVADAGLGRATADHMSQISPLIISASGSVTASASLSSPQDTHFIGSGTSSGSSSFSYTFDLSTPTAVSLDAMLISDGSDPPSGTNLTSFSFVGPTGAIIDFSTTSPISRNTIPFTYADTLAAGRYTLAASASANATPPAPDPTQAASGAESSSFSLTLQVVPEPGALLIPAVVLTMMIRRRPRTIGCE